MTKENEDKLVEAICGMEVNMEYIATRLEILCERIGYVPRTK